MSVGAARQPLSLAAIAIHTGWMQVLSAYLNGRWVTGNELAIPLDDLGFALGATVVERLRTFGGQVFRLDDHLARLHRSLDIVGIDTGVVTTLESVIIECADRSRGALAAGDDLSMVVLVTPTARSNRPSTVCVYAFPLAFGGWAEQYQIGVAIAISQTRQVPGNCWPTELKCRSRMHYYLAEREAAARFSRGSVPSARAVLLDQEGYVGEATAANVLIYQTGEGRENEGLLTPPRDRVLPGVTLGVTEELAARLEIPFAEKLFTPGELKLASEMLLVSTSICVLPVVQCDGQPIGGGRPGPVFQKLLTAWNELAGVDIAEQARRFAGR